jgi:predicted component of type VI protein secretion system
MKYALIFLVALLTGCSTTVPVVAKFPEVPQHLLVKCPQLNKVNDDAKLSDVAKTITINYAEYYSCAVKNDAWIEWYQIQKTIFQGLK